MSGCTNDINENYVYEESKRGMKKSSDSKNYSYTF